MQNLAQICANSICPVCGMPVDDRLPPTIGLTIGNSGSDEADILGDQIARMGACSCEHANILATNPQGYIVAAINNLTAGVGEDG